MLRNFFCNNIFRFLQNEKQSTMDEIANYGAIVHGYPNDPEEATVEERGFILEEVLDSTNT